MTCDGRTAITGGHRGFVRKSDIWFVLNGEKRGLFLTLIGIVV